jgi:hypothetical protein
MDAKTEPEAQQPTSEPPVQAEIVREGIRLFHRQIGIIRQASILELMMYLLVAAGFGYRELKISLYSHLDPLVLLTSPGTMISLGIAFIAAFSLILNGSTPIVSMVVRNRGELEQGLLFSHRFRQVLTPEVSETDHRKSVSGPPADAEQAEPTEAIEKNFSNYIARSQEATRIAQKRPNALLFVGTIIAAAGLIFFVMTLPGSRYGFLDATPAGADLKTDFWASMVQLVPRLLMLIFIQVLAGFFLRQYRSSMEDFRYYESVLRHREAQYLSYTLRKKMDDKKALLKFAEELLTPQEIGVLAKGRTTTVLEAQRNELNEFSTLYEKFASLFSKAEKAAKKQSE